MNEEVPEERRFAFARKTDKYTLVLTLLVTIGCTVMLASISIAGAIQAWTLREVSKISKEVKENREEIHAVQLAVKGIQHDRFTSADWTVHSDTIRKEMAGLRSELAALRERMPDDFPPTWFRKEWEQ